MWHFIRQFQIYFIFCLLGAVFFPSTVACVSRIINNQGYFCVWCIALVSDTIIMGNILWWRIKVHPFRQLVEQTERVLSHIPCSSPSSSLLVFVSESTHTFMRMFMHTAIIWLYVSVIMAEAIIFCRLKRPGWLLLCFFVPLLCFPFASPLYHYFSSSGKQDFVSFINSNSVLQCLTVAQLTGTMVKCISDY